MDDKMKKEDKVKDKQQQAPQRGPKPNWKKLINSEEEDENNNNTRKSLTKYKSNSTHCSFRLSNNKLTIFVNVDSKNKKTLALNTRSKPI